MISPTSLLRTAGLALTFLLGGVATAVASVITLPAGQAGVSYSHAITTNPAAPEGTTYAASGLPGGLAIGISTGVISGTPNQSGVFTGVISLTSGAIVNNFDYTLTIAAALGTPEITSDLTALGAVGEEFAAFLTASNSPESFNVGALPPGLSFDAGLAAITGTPTVAGTYEVTLSANNTTGTGGVVVLVITIEPSGPVPAITSAAAVQADLNTPFSYQITATNTPTGYSASGLPVGLGLDAGTGLISGTPTVAGVTAVTLTASNGNGVSANFTLTLTLGPVSSLNSPSSLTAWAGYPITPYQLAATNSPLSFNVGALPNGLSYNSANAQITGTPQGPGSANVILSANNATGTGPNFTLAITVGTAVAPAISAQPQSQSADPGQTVVFSVTASGTPAPTYQWRRNGNPISGATASTYTVPSAGSGDAGAYTVVVTNLAGSVTSEAADLTLTATGFDAWALGYFSSGELQDESLSGSQADPDGDGLVNLLEYALGLHPREVSTAGLPATGRTATHWTYTYTRPADRADLDYAVQVSTSLTGWSTDGVTHELIGTQDGVETWRASYPAASAPTLFFRLRVASASPPPS